MILDACAGNRTMWNWKDCPDFIYIDIEKKLAVKPSIFASNEHLPFKDKCFSSIFFDPPHGWGKTPPFYAYPDSKSFKKKWQGYGEIPRYYGWDKYKSKTALIANIFRAQREFYRCLKDDGLLWFKWNDVKTSIKNLMPVFELWAVLLFLHISAPSHTAGKHQTYWICMIKEKERKVQTTLC